MFLAMIIVKFNDRLALEAVVEWVIVQNQLGEIASSQFELLALMEMRFNE